MKSLNNLADSITDQAEDVVEGYDEAVQELRMRLPHGVDIKDAIDYGFYEHKHRYWMRRTGDSFEPCSNFTMKVLYLIRGKNPKRIVEITNVYKKTASMDLAVEDLISIERFKGRVEGQGNFLFEGKATDLARIKNKLFTIEKAAEEVTRLGHQRNELFVWANGIYDGNEFYPIDERGMVQHGPDHYYIPIFGGTMSDDDEDLRNYRKFLHRTSAVTWREWSAQFVKVYGENGKVGIAFAIYAIFSDIIFSQTKAAPMLFLFGQRGSGKGVMANSLLSLFGFAQDALMLGGASTVVGFMRKLGQFANAIVWLDEYKNDIGEKKIESLKNIWDRVGYERGVKDASNKTQVTPVTSSAIVSGQEMPNVEPALFSRMCLCVFKAMQRTQEEVNAFDTLRRMEDNGITSATLELLRCRPQVKKHFQQKYTEIAAHLRKAFSGEDIIERQISNYAILCAAVWSVQDHIALPFDYAEMMLISERFMKQQAAMMKTANEVQQFFEMVAFLMAEGSIQEGKDIQIQDQYVRLRMVSVYPLYRSYSNQQRLKTLDKGTLINYLQNSEAYDEKESKKGSHRFSNLHGPTTAYVFLHHKILELFGVDLVSISKEPENQQDNSKAAF
jgi:hypothetical protein